jgi:hypothetical protein
MAQGQRAADVGFQGVGRDTDAHLPCRHWTRGLRLGAIAETAMIDRTRFDAIRQRHGCHASWAVWAEASETPKSNIGDLSVLDVESNGSLLETIKGDVVMVGLNISRSFSEPFRNFHDPSPKANDFKIRYAFANTKYYGAYMTDIIKDVAMVDSNDLLEHLKAFPSLVRQNINAFREELQGLNSGKPTILAFGSAAHRLLAEHISGRDYSRLIKVTHYSHRISKENYRQSVLAQIDSIADVG